MTYLAKAGGVTSLSPLNGPRMIEQTREELTKRYTDTNRFFGRKCAGIRQREQWTATSAFQNASSSMLDQLVSTCRQCHCAIVLDVEVDAGVLLLSIYNDLWIFRRALVTGYLIIPV
jgi:hypothetical protein